MIRNYKDYRLYLEADRLALGRGKFNFRAWLFDRVWLWERLLRRAEYLTNSHDNHSIAGWLKYFILRRVVLYRLHRLNLGLDIPINCFGPGLSIAHGGKIVVNPKVRVGKNCRIHVDVVLGQGKDSEDVPVIGDNVHICPGVKILGGVHIGDNTVILANAVVTKNFSEGNCTIGGVPARKISDKTSLTPSGNLGRGLVVLAYEKALDTENV